MKKATKLDAQEPGPEYDFSTGAKNPYAERFAKGTNLVLIEPDLFRSFPSEKDVNDALRLLLKAGTQALKSKEPRTAKAS